MRRTTVILGTTLGMVLCCASLPTSAQDGTTLVDRPLEKRLGDLDSMLDAGYIRVLVSYSQTNFFIEKGVQRGFECELFREYEKMLGGGKKRKQRRTQIVFIPLSFDRLLPALAAGHGDIAASGLTITPDRKKLVDFTDPYLSGVSEILVASKTAHRLSGLEDLAGRTIVVKMGSSFERHLTELSQKLEASGKPAIDIRNGSEDLETEDLLELAHAGIIDYTVADRHVAEIWSPALPNIVLRKDLVVHQGGQLAWAVRKNSPKLRRSLNEYVTKTKKGTLLGNIFFKRYYKSTKWVGNPTTAAERRKLEALKKHFQKYGEQYGFEWLLMAAQGYQESRLDQSVRSHAGAIGIMQLLTSTAKDMGITRIDVEEHNIHAGVKYMHWLRKHYFSDPDIEPSIRIDFALAAYNAGPGRVRGWRRKAAAMKLDPNRWFHNVELVSLREIGQETVRYVGNINKYYIAYKLSLENRERKEEFKKRVSSGN